MFSVQHWWLDDNKKGEEKAGWRALVVASYMKIKLQIMLYELLLQIVLVHITKGMKFTFFQPIIYSYTILFINNIY